MVRLTKGADKGCGSSWGGVIGMKGTSKWCGSCGDGVTVWFEGFRVLSKGVVHLLMG